VTAAKGAPLVSVVIPAYNAARFIERTLTSALRQTHRNLEILVIDDGSTDDTRPLVEAVTGSDDRVRIISVPNGGVAKARNIGIAESSGPLIAFLDADDLWHPRKVELQLAALLAPRGEDVAAVYAFSRVIDLDDRVVQPGSTFVCEGYVLARLLYAKFIGNGSSILVRREIAVAAGGYEPAWAARGIGGCEDLDFELKIAAKHAFLAVPQFLVGYRVYAGNMSSDASRMARALVATIEHHVRANPAVPRWAGDAALGSAHEYACSLLMRERLGKRALEQFACLARCDAGRALDVAATIVARKFRRLGKTQEAPAGEERPVFSGLDPSAIAGLPHAASRRDRLTMNRLASLDAALGKKAAVERPEPRALARTGYRESAF
jgi:hypothetical protein